MVLSWFCQTKTMFAINFIHPISMLDIQSQSSFMLKKTLEKPCLDVSNFFLCFKKSESEDYNGSFLIDHMRSIESTVCHADKLMLQCD